MPRYSLAAVAILCVPMQAQEERMTPEKVQEIIRQATAKMQADWAAAPNFAFVQRDVTTSKGVTTSRTQQVFMIAGSDYYMPIAVDGQPLPEAERELEVKRLKQEVERRKHETSEQAAKRSEKYRKIREQNGILLNEFTRGFDFSPAGEETLDSRTAYVFDARPRPGYHPPNRTAKILTGMQGRLWVDKETCQWLKAEAEVLKPVSVFGFFAKVLPGTKMELEMTPVTDSVWQVSRFAVDLKTAVLWWKSSKKTETIFSDYQPAAPALVKALAQLASRIGSRAYCNSDPSTGSGTALCFSAASWNCSSWNAEPIRF